MANGVIVSPKKSDKWSLLGTVTDNGDLTVNISPEYTELMINFTYSGLTRGTLLTVPMEYFKSASVGIFPDGMISTLRIYCKMVYISDTTIRVSQCSSDMTSNSMEMLVYAR